MIIERAKPTENLSKRARLTRKWRPSRPSAKVANHQENLQASRSLCDRPNLMPLNSAASACVPLALRWLSLTTREPPEERISDDRPSHAAIQMAIADRLALFHTLGGVDAMGVAVKNWKQGCACVRMLCIAHDPEALSPEKTESHASAASAIPEKRSCRRSLSGSEMQTRGIGADAMKKNRRIAASAASH